MGLEAGKRTMPPPFASFALQLEQPGLPGAAGPRRFRDAGREGRQAGTPERCQQPPAFPWGPWHLVCFDRGQAVLLLIGCWTWCSLPGGRRGWELTDSRHS